MKYLSLTALVTCSALLAQPAFSKDRRVNGQVPMDDAFVENTLRFQGIGGKMTYRLAIKGRNGNLGVCGVVHYGNSQLRSISKKFLRTLTLDMNGQTILKDLSFLTVAKSKKKVDTTPASCVFTNIRIPSQKADFKLGGGDVVFRN